MRVRSCGHRHPAICCCLIVARICVAPSQLIFTDLTGQRRSVAEHFAEFVAQIQLALEQNPSQINCHSGRDR